MCNSTSINEINSSRNTISIFPNPTYTEINIIDSSAESFQVELINANGQIIMKEQNKSKIDISNLNNGLFYINIKKGQLNYIYKVIKQ
jgi:hypothetical protein